MVHLTPQEKSLAVFVVGTALLGLLCQGAFCLFPDLARQAAFIDRTARTAGVLCPVNINTAGFDELVAVPGIGPSTARRIIEERTRQGPFLGIADLVRVKGLKAGKLRSLAAQLCTESAP